MSKFLRLNEYDAIKWFIVAVVSAWLTALYNLLEMGTLMGIAERKSVAIAWILAWLAYLIKNVFSNSLWELLKKEPEDTMSA